MPITTWQRSCRYVYPYNLTVITERGLQSQGIADEARNHKSGIASWGLEQIIKAVPEAEELVRYEHP